MRRTEQHRGARALGTAAIFVVAFSGSATARADESGQHSQAQYECHYLNKCAGSLSQPKDPDAGGEVEYLQLGAGVLDKVLARWERTGGDLSAVGDAQGDLGARLLALVADARREGVSAEEVLRQALRDLDQEAQTGSNGRSGR